MTTPTDECLVIILTARTMPTLETKGASPDKKASKKVRGGFEIRNIPLDKAANSKKLGMVIREVDIN